MALRKIKSGEYIKVDLSGNFKIYKSSKDRQREKNTKLYLKIILKYAEVINNLSLDLERQYYDPTFKLLIAD